MINSKLPFRKLELTKAMRVGDPAIDDEHRDLVEIINNIANARDEGRNEDCKKIILHFADSVKKHFRREEEILDELGFPRLDEHIKHHWDIERELQDILQDTGVNISDQKIWESVYQSLVSILVDDAIKVDMDFKSFLMDRRS